MRLSVRPAENTWHKQSDQSSRIFAHSTRRPSYTHSSSLWTYPFILSYKSQALYQSGNHISAQCVSMVSLCICYNHKIHNTCPQTSTKLLKKRDISFGVWRRWKLGRSFRYRFETIFHVRQGDGILTIFPFSSVVVVLLDMPSPDNISTEHPYIHNLFILALVADD